MKTNNGFVYTGKETKEISFPIGGIGTGCIGLSGNGRLIDFEIFNKPNKNSFNGFTHIAVKAEDEWRVLDARVLNGNLQPPYMGEANATNFRGYGFGVNRLSLAGLPHFEETVFTGAFPFAHIDFKDGYFPGQVRLNAFNPFIPLNDKDSSIPAAFFEIEFENTTDRELTYTAALSLTNPVTGNNINTFSSKDNLSIIQLKNTKHEEDSTEFGDICIATDSADVAVQEYWFRGRWFDSLGVFWKDFTSFGKLKNRDSQAVLKTVSDTRDYSDTATLTGVLKIAPKSKGTVRFIISWNYPNCINYWNPEKCECGESCLPNTWKNYYATVFKNSFETAVYSLENYRKLEEQTNLFRDALFSSTLPDSILDAVTANISILKSPTCLRLEDGSFYGFEGCHCNAGCCEGSCTHVWNYAYALPFLFPALERSMRELDFKYNMNEHGGMALRLQLPLGREKSALRPCADGQFGGVIKAYRDWKISGDDNWLKEMWPSIKKNMEFAWDEHNQDKWDSAKTGVLHGRQHHTLDMELFGPNSWLTGFYLAALKAATEIARYLGENETAHEYMELFYKGKAYIEENLFNGEFYYQKIDVTDKSILDGYENAGGYWNEEAGEIKYQIGEGLVIDAVLAQWHANICGLGEIFDADRVKKTLQSIYKYNFKKDMRNHFNPCRIFCLNDESGTVICEWPDASKKPSIPVPYAEETMHGFEYQVAIHMLQEGMIDEGVELIKAVRDRYDGYRRNPWNEIECGSNYARSMASYAALLAYSGFEFDMPKKTIGFNPIVKGDFKCFWSLDNGWGIFEKADNEIVLTVLYGRLELSVLKIHVTSIYKATLEAQTLNCKIENGEVLFDGTIVMTEGNKLKIKGETI